MTLIDSIKKLLKIKSEAKRVQPAAAAKTNTGALPAQIDKMVEENVRKPIFERLKVLDDTLSEQKAEIDRLKGELNAAQQERDELKKTVAELKQEVEEVHALLIINSNPNPFALESPLEPEKRVTDGKDIHLKVTVDDQKSATEEVVSKSSPVIQIPKKAEIKEKPGLALEDNIIEPVNARLAVVKDDPVSTAVLMAWIERLLGHGKEGFTHALDYYVQVGWISKGVAALMKNYSQGIDIDPKKGECITPLTVDLHMESLVFIEELNGNNGFDKQVMNTIKSKLAAFQEGAKA